MMLTPLSVLIAGMVFADGDEIISTIGNLISGIGNILLSIPLCIFMGIGAEKVVAIYYPKGVEYIATRIGVIMAGAAWVGLEDMMGSSRTAYVIKDCGCEVVFNSELWEEAMQMEPSYDFADPDDHDLAFFIYTSGSTGEPKGAANEYGIYDYIMEGTNGFVGPYYNWQVWNTKAYSRYTSTTSRIDKKSAGQAVLSILRFCQSVGFVKYQENGDHPSIVISDKELISVRTAKSGIFEPLVKVGDSVDEGTPLAEIINPYDGSVMETLYAPRRGTLFFMHSDPITYAETAVIKMV